MKKKEGTANILSHHGNENPDSTEIPSHPSQDACRWEAHAGEDAGRGKLYTAGCMQASLASAEITKGGSSKTSENTRAVAN